MEHPPRESWDVALEFYRTLTNHGPQWSHIPRFSEFVSDLSQYDEIKWLHAVTSHENLIVSPFSSGSDVLVGRRVVLHPTVNGDIEISCYLHGAISTVEYKCEKMSECLPIVLRMIRSYLLLPRDMRD